MKRRPVNSPKKDKRFFRRTAISSKRLNVNPPVFRGGIRLWKEVICYGWFLYIVNSVHSICDCYFSSSLNSNDGYLFIAFICKN